MKKLKSLDYLVTYTEIHPLSDEGDILYKLSANIDERGNYFMPSLQLLGISEERAKEEELEIYWDSEHYIIEVLRRNLINTIEGTGPIDSEAMESIEKHIPESDYQLVVDIIDQGVALGFFKEYYDQVNYPDEQK